MKPYTKEAIVFILLAICPMIPLIFIEPHGCFKDCKEFSPIGEAYKMTLMTVGYFSWAYVSMKIAKLFNKDDRMT